MLAQLRVEGRHTLGCAASILLSMHGQQDKLALQQLNDGCSC